MNEQDAVPDFVEAIVNERTAELRAAFDRQTTRLATLSASERNLAKERNDYKERAERAEADAARLAAALREAWTEDDDARDALGLPLIWIRHQDALLAHDALVAEADK